MPSLSVIFDTSTLMAALNRLPAALDCRRDPMRDAMAAASADVMRFEHRHFTEASGGGGGWPDIKPATKAARLLRQMGRTGGRKGGGPSIAAMARSVQMPILNETGTLEAGLFELGDPGHFREFTADSVEEGVSGGTHPNFKGTIGKLAVIHQYGAGSVPARPEYVPIDGQTEAAVSADLHKGYAAVIAGLGSGGGNTAAQVAAA